MSRKDLFVSVCRQHAADALGIGEDRVLANGFEEDNGDILIELYIDGTHPSDDQIHIINSYVNRLLAAEPPN